MSWISFAASDTESRLRVQRRSNERVPAWRARLKKQSVECSQLARAKVAVAVASSGWPPPRWSSSWEVRRPTAPRASCSARGRCTWSMPGSCAREKRGTFYVELRFPNTGTRSWKVVPVVGRYAQITGGGRIPRVGGHARAWRARLEGFLTLREGARQRVVITIKGRPDGGFELTPLQPGLLRRDSGKQSSAWSG